MRQNNGEHFWQSTIQGINKNSPLWTIKYFCPKNYLKHLRNSSLPLPETETVTTLIASMFKHKKFEVVPFKYKVEFGKLEQLSGKKKKNHILVILDMHECYSLFPTLSEHCRPVVTNKTMFWRRMWKNGRLTLLARYFKLY